MALQTEFHFKLPHGYADKDGKVHQRGIMRLATAEDEISSVKDIHVQQNPDYLLTVLLSKVILELDALKPVDTNMIESLSGPDLAYLQEFYEKVNGFEPYRPGDEEDYREI